MMIVVIGIISYLIINMVLPTSLIWGMFCGMQLMGKGMLLTIYLMIIEVLPTKYLTIMLVLSRKYLIPKELKQMVGISYNNNKTNNNKKKNSNKKTGKKMAL